MTSRRRRSRAEPQPVAETRGFLLPVRWEVPKDTSIIFSNHIFVRLQDDHVIITFGQAELPYEVQVTEETRTRLQAEGLPVQVVARLATTPQKLGEMAEQMNRIHNIWLERQGQGQGQSNDATEQIAT